MRAKVFLASEGGRIVGIASEEYKRSATGENFSPHRQCYFSCSHAEKFSPRVTKIFARMPQIWIFSHHQRYFYRAMVRKIQRWGILAEILFEEATPLLPARPANQNLSA